MLRQIIPVTLLLLAACGDSTGPGTGGGGGGGGATLAGTVRVAGQSATLAGATVSAGTLKATSDENGHFELTSVPVGTATVRAERPGYQPAEATITLAAGANSHDFGLTAQEIYQFGAIAALVPAGTEPMRGTIVTIGGPFTNGFVTGQKIAHEADPVLEQSLQDLGASLRALARSTHMALIGSSTTNMTSSAASDDALLAAVRATGEKSGHAELASAPLLIFGISNGSPEAVGLAARQPGRTIGLLVRVPTGVASLTSSEALAVPAFVMQAGLDDKTRNAAVLESFLANRSRGGLWSLVVEPDVVHAQASARANAACVAWLSRVAGLRLPSASGTSLIMLEEESGWLGNQTSLSTAAWADYTGDRAAASWLLNEAAAGSWKILGTPEGTGGGGGGGTAAAAAH
ncbi:MAG TPA: carboxypeptidase-like regulatory domain-containing protein [Gemmatimonadales bacterium]